MDGTEPVAAAPSTADVASEVIEQADADESGGEYTPTTPDTDGLSATKSDAPAADVPAQTPAVIAEPLSDEEALLHEFGFKHATKPDGRQHYIPRDKVLKMIASGLKRGQEKWTGERTEFESKVNTYKADLEEMYADIRGEPKALIEKIAQHDPRYKVFLEPLAPVAPAPAPVPLTQMPDPDLTLQDGSRTYSIQGLQKLLEWNTAQVEAKLLPKVDERIKPFTEREAQAKQREQAEQATNQVRERTQQMIADAQQWPGFKEHEQEILKALQEDTVKARAEKRKPTLSLEAAYRQAVLPKLSADRNKMREELLKEISAGAKAGPTVAGGAGVPPKAGTLSTADIARRTMEAMERGQ